MNVFLEMSFPQLQKQAANLYGKAGKRPQEINKNLLLQTRRTNQQIIVPRLINYPSELIDWASTVNLPIKPQEFKRKKLYVSTAEELKSALKELGFRSVDVLSMDFECHCKDSLSGNK